MIKLTPTQKADLYDVYNSTCTGITDGLVGVCRAYHQMIQKSKTHRVVEVPEGYEWHNTASPSYDTNHHAVHPYVKFGFSLRRPSKPCPPPVLEPVTVTVEQKYPKGYDIPEGWQYRFDTAGNLKRLGFTHGLAMSEHGPATHIYSFSSVPAMIDTALAIGLKKWGD